MAYNKIGFVFSGAGARIAQECALTRVLVEDKNIVPDVVAGASSGALNAVALNAILKYRADPNPWFTWDDYTTEILFPLENGDIFDQSGGWKRRVLTRNIPNGYVLDNGPAKELFAKSLFRMGFDTLGSLYLPTYISVVNRMTGATRRLFSRDPDPEVRDLKLVDLLLASTSIPVVFPPYLIPRQGLFVDGGTTQDSIPVESVSGEACTEIYVVSRSRQKPPEQAMDDAAAHLKIHLWKLHKEGDEEVTNILKNMSFILDAMSDTFFRIGLCHAGEYASSSAYLYMPVLDDYFSMLDFGTQKEQYEETMTWAQTHDPIRL